MMMIVIIEQDNATLPCYAVSILQSSSRIGVFKYIVVALQDSARGKVLLDKGK